MKKEIHTWGKRLVKLSAAVLPDMASVFAMAPCSCKMYEPKLPEKLKR